MGKRYLTLEWFLSPGKVTRRDGRTILSLELHKNDSTIVKIP
jgi:hypothetical protein